MRRRLLNTLIFLFFCSCVFSCRPEKQADGYSMPRFKVEATQEFEIIGLELDLSRVSSVKAYKNYLILLGQNRWTKQFLHVIDKKTGAIVHSSVALGRGPGEVLSTPWLSLVGQECYLYDQVLDVTQVYDLEKILQGEVGYSRTIRDLEGPSFTIGYFYGPEGRVILRNESFMQRDSSQTRPRIILDLNETRYTYNEYPVTDRVRSYWMYMTPYLTISPDFSKMAIVPAYGAILERFSLSDAITLKGVDRFIAPDFSLNGTNPDFSERGVPVGFTNLTSTNDRILVGMVGEVVSDLGSRKTPEQMFPLFPVLAVFDWEGRPLVRVRNSMNIECPGYDEEESVVYAVVLDAKGSRFLGRMKL